MKPGSSNVAEWVLASCHAYAAKAASSASASASGRREEEDEDGAALGVAAMFAERTGTARPARRPRGL